MSNAAHTFMFMFGGCCFSMRKLKACSSKNYFLFRGGATLGSDAQKHKLSVQTHLPCAMSTTTAKPIALIIDIEEANKGATCPAYLEERLKVASPTKTPETLAECMQKASALRAVYLEAVKDRAARETQRAQEVASRKLRLAANRVERVQRKIDSTFSHVKHVKETTEAERQARMARKAETTLAVAEARNTAAAARLARQSELANAEKDASTKYMKHLESVVSKSASQVKHAAAVVAAQKEKERLDIDEAAEKLEARLEKGAHTYNPMPPHSLARLPRAHPISFCLLACAAALVRSTRLSKDVGSPAEVKTSPRHRVLNESKVTAETRRRSLDAAMAKAAEKRSAFVQATQEKASAVGAKAASVVAKQQAKADGTDAHVANAKAQLYERLLKAEVARLTFLKDKYQPKTSTGVMLVIPTDDMSTPKAPPSALVRRLTTVGQTLVATSAARQLAALARRDGRAAAAVNKMSVSKARRAAALGRVAHAIATTAMKKAMKKARAAVVLTNAHVKRAVPVAAEKRRAAAAADKRAATADALVAAGLAATKASEAAHARHADKTRARAKKGVLAVRAAAVKSRRDAADAADLVKASVNGALRLRATAKRDELLAARVALAKKLTVAPHAKRVMADADVEPSSEC